MADTNHATTEQLGGSSEYQRRKLAGECTRGRCPRRAIDGGQLCEEHLESERERVRRQAQRRRDERAPKKQCADCSAKTNRHRCLACALRFRSLPTKKVPNKVTTEAFDRIAAATRVDATGRSRYHGQMRRGGPTTAMREEQDLQTLRWAVEEIRKSIEGLGLLDLPRFAEALKSERAAARRAALSQAALAIRLVEEVLDRNRYSDAATEMVPR